MTYNKSLVLQGNNSYYYYNYNYLPLENPVIRSVLVSNAVLKSSYTHHLCFRAVYCERKEQITISNCSFAISPFFMTTMLVFWGCLLTCFKTSDPSNSADEIYTKAHSKVSVQRVCLVSTRAVKREPL